MSELISEVERRGIPLERGVQFLALDRLAHAPFDPGLALVILPPAASGAATAAIAEGSGTALPGRHGHGVEPLALLRRLYPPDHPVLGLGEADGDTTIERLDETRLAAGAWLLPALAPDLALATPHGLPWLVARLRAPDGCPWDREQDHLTLRPFLLEEAYEVYDALEAGSSPQLAEELGDLLLQIVLHAQYAAEAGAFDLSDVYREVMAKIIRRHPHVFGEVEAATAADVIRNWEQIKATERAGRTPRDHEMPAAFAGLSLSLPALAYASEMQARAAGLGYDWPDTDGVIDKIAEEASELAEVTDEAGRREEFGDLLFVVVNLGRKLGIDSEAALRAASRKFAGRFGQVERIAAEEGLDLHELNLDALDGLWQRAKRIEAGDLAARAAPVGSRP